jgi:hypothetical protein
MSSSAGTSILFVVVFISACAWHVASGKFRLALIGSFMTTYAALFVISGLEKSWKFDYQMWFTLESLMGLLMLFGFQSVVYIIIRAIMKIDRSEVNERHKQE